VDDAIRLSPTITDNLRTGETIEAAIWAANGVMVLTPERVLVADEARVALNVPIDGLRRIQFDIERRRPATLVIVPERSTDEAQVLGIPPAEYRNAAEALSLIGERLHKLP
jgi:hypothetical protein